MKISKKILSLVLCAALASSLMAGCASNAEDKPLDPPAPLVTADQEAEAPVTEPAVTTIPQEETEAPTEAETTEATTTEAPVTTEETTTAAPVTTVPETTTVATTTTEATTTQATMAVTPMDAVMYALSDVNVRSGPDASFDRLGHVSGGKSVNVTGLCENGWYRIEFKGGVGYVSNSYLSAGKPAEVTTAATTAATTVATTAASKATEKKEDTKVTEVKNTKWLASWGNAMLTAGDGETPKNPTLKGNTVRQQIRVTVGGSRARLVISNEYGKTDLVIESIKIAKLENFRRPNVDLSTEVTITYNGSTKITVPAGKKITTEEFDFEMKALDDLAITMKLGDVPAVISSHTASRSSTWVIKGDHVSDNDYSSATEMTSWYFINDLHVLAPENSCAIVCIGDSITDGASINTNSFARYSDELARLMRKDSSMNNISVIGKGIGATFVRDVMNRFDRDVIQTPGVKYCIVMYGTNDIGYSGSDVSQDVIKQYKRMIEACHKKGIKIIGCTITPNKGSGHYSAEKEKMRLAVNKFIMSADSGFDGYIDMSSAVCDPSDSAKLKASYNSTTWNDWLHLSQLGYQRMGKEAYEYMKEFIANDK